MTNQQQNARQILRDEYSKRSAANPRYSLRSYAKTLGISHTVLSLVLSGKRPLSRKAALKAADRLALSPVQLQLLLSREYAAKPAAAGASAYEFDAITHETFTAISDWIHYAILSLLEVDGARFEPAWVAQRLGVTELGARTAMERLQSIGLIEQTKGKWRQSTKPIKFENTVSTSATRRLHKQLLEKAIASLENDPMEVRDVSSITLAMDPALIPYAKEKIREFRRELTKDLESRGRAKEVYNLTVQIFPVSKNTKELS